MTEYVVMGAEELIEVTRFLHQVKTSVCDKLVCAIEKPRPEDRSVVFHMIDIIPPEKETTTVVMLSAEFIKDHPFWEKDCRPVTV